MSILRKAGTFSPKPALTLDFTPEPRVSRRHPQYAQDVALYSNPAYTKSQRAAFNAAKLAEPALKPITWAI